MCLCSCALLNCSRWLVFIVAVVIVLWKRRWGLQEYSGRYSVDYGERIRSRVLQITLDLSSLEEDQQV